MNIATQIILSVLVLILAGWCVYRESVIRELRARERVLYRRGKAFGMKVERRHWMNRRLAELHAADRIADVRPDSGGPSRISRINIQRRFDT